MATCVVPIVPIVPFLSCPLVLHRCQSLHQPEPLEAEPLEVQQGPHQGVRESGSLGIRESVVIIVRLLMLSLYFPFSVSSAQRLFRHSIIVVDVEYAKYG
jgi:hypothetical protein